MDNKNVIAAISLSAAVIILYSLFFQPDPKLVKQKLAEKEKIEQATDTPSIEKKENIKKISRNDSLAENKRIKFENENIIGSISLKGAVIDDLIFKEYNISLDNKQKVTLLNPRNTENGYLIESGFVTNDKNIDTPNSNSNWITEGNDKLTPENPVKLSWKNPQGITF